MGGIYRRGRKFWIWYFDAGGVRRFVPTSATLDEGDRARQVLAEVERRVAAEKRANLPVGALTVRAYSERWLEGRPGQGVATAKTEARHLRMHVWPTLGDVLLKDLRPHHVRDLVRELVVKEVEPPRSGTLAPRYVRNIYGTLRTMLHDAEVDELIASNPCKVKRGELPKKTDKDRGWRATAVFTRAEVETLLGDQRLPEDRRLWAALLFLTGLRFGEAAALRWRHYDEAVTPLGQLTVVNSWNSDLGLETSTKTEAPRLVPVHPVLAKMLAAWKVGGWQRHFGRPPRPDDLIAPNRHGRHRNVRRALEFFHADCDALGLRRRRQHDSRRTFTSLARAGGARADVIEWIKDGPGESVTDLYTTLPWETLCEELLKLKVDLREGEGQLLRLPRAVAAGAVTACDSGPTETTKPREPRRILGASSARSRGFEPPASSHEGLRRSGSAGEHGETSSVVAPVGPLALVDPRGPPRAGSVTARVTVDAPTLVALVELARRLEPEHPAVAAALAALEGA